MLKKIVVVLIVIHGATLAGCASTLNYDRDLVGNPAPATQRPIQGKAAIFTTVTEDQVIFSGNPTSFTGSATSLSIPFGVLLKEVSLIVFGKVFSEGVDHVSSMPSSEQYTYVVRPYFGSFSYAYNQAKNFGLAVTPQAELTLLVSIFDEEGSLQSRKTYSSGLRDGDSYAISGSPSEKINRLAHLLSVELLSDAARDLNALSEQ